MLEHDPDSTIRRAAASLLGSLKDPAAIPSLIATLDDPDISLRLEATRALARYGSSVNTPAVVEKWLAGVSSGQSEEQRDASVQALELIAPDEERVVRWLAEVLSKDQSDDREKPRAFVDEPG